MSSKSASTGTNGCTGEEAAVRDLTEAAASWAEYTDAARARYKNPFWTNRVGYVDWDLLAAEVERDVEIAAEDP